jgi:hypothetical protein
MRKKSSLERGGAEQTALPTATASEGSSIVRPCSATYHESVKSPSEYRFAGVKPAS